MNKQNMKNKFSKFLNIILLILIFLSACTKSATNTVSDLNNYVVETIVKNYENGEVKEPDIVIEHIYYGSFSQSNNNEILVICKILNTPHVAGLDKTVCVLYNTNSLEMISYKEFAADNVVISDIPTSNGQDKILVLQTVTYQGISTQELHLFVIQDGEWIDDSVDPLENLDDEYFYFVEDNMIIASINDKLTSLKDISAILIWNPDTERYILIK